MTAPAPTELLKLAAKAAYDFLQDKSFIPDSDTHVCTKICEQLDEALRQAASVERAGPTGIEAANLVAEYLTLCSTLDDGDAANIIHILHERGVQFASPASVERADSTELDGVQEPDDSHEDAHALHSPADADHALWPSREDPEHEMDRLAPSRPVKQAEVAREAVWLTALLLARAALDNPASPTSRDRAFTAIAAALASFSRPERESK